MNENNNMNNDYTNNPAPAEPAENLYQEASAQTPQEPAANTYEPAADPAQQPAQPAETMYHYSEQGIGQVQAASQNTGGQYQYSESYQQSTQQQYDAYNSANQWYDANSAQQNASATGTSENANQYAGGQQYHYDTTQQSTNADQQSAGQQYQSYNANTGTGDQFTGGQQNYNANAYTTYQTPGQQPAHGKAIASLVLGIAGLVCCGICGLIGLILAVSAKNEGNDEGIRTAGFVLGIIGCVVWGIGIIFAAVDGAFTAALY